MNIKCPGCGQRYRVDPQRIPVAGASVKCMQCDHLIEVSPGMSVSELKRVIVCPDCAKPYRIAENKIPAHLTATRCKACGGAIPLARPVSENPMVGSKPDRVLGEAPGAGQSQDAVKPSETPVSIPESASVDTPHAIASHHNAGLLQQWWFLITGAVVVVLLLCITLWIAMNQLPDDDESPTRPASDVAQESPTGAPNRPMPDRETVSRDVVVTPVAGITLRAPVLLKAVQGSSYAAKLPPPAQMGMMSLATLSLGSIDLFLCHDEAGVLWPVLRVEKPMARFLAGQFGSDGPLADYFIQKDEFTYYLNEPVITGVLSQMLSARATEGQTNILSQDELSSVPLEQYAVVLGENQVWLAPDCVLSALEQFPDLFEQASWTAWMKPAVSDEDVLRIYAQVPGDIDNQWTSWVLENEFVQAHPEAGIELLVATTEAPITAMLKSVSRLEQVVLAVACPTVDQRRVTWVQQFNDVTLAQEVSERLKAGSVGGELGGHPLMPLVMRIMNCPELRRTTDLKARRLTVTLTWTEQDDLAILNQLGTGTDPEMPDETESSESSESSDVAPVDLAEDQNGPAAELLEVVGLTRHLDESTWREQLSDRFVQALMPSSNNGFGMKNAHFLEVDAWGDNASLASVFYEVRQVMSPDNQRLKECLGAREKMVGRRIRVPVPDGTLAGEAMIQFDVTVPSDLDVAVLDVSAGHEVINDMVTGSVAMAKVADHTVRLSYKGLFMPSVYAFDRLGNKLRRERITREPDGVYLVFGGGVQTCLVVGVKEEISHTFEARVNLNPGQAVVLSYVPEVPQYTRFDQTPLINYAEMVSLDANDLTVDWHQEKQPSHFKQRLSVALPENVAVQPAWEVFAHHRENKVRLNGASMVDNQQASFLCRDMGSRRTDQMSGSVLLDVFGQIERVTLRQQDLDNMCCIKMPGNTYLDLTLDKNTLSYMVLGGDVVQLAAYDDQGRRLMQDPAWRFQQGMKSVYFWGVPDKVVLDISTQTKVSRLDFKVTEPLEPTSRPQYTTSLPALTR